MVHVSVDSTVGAGVGFVVGAFTPAVGRKIKAGFVALARKIVAAGEADLGKVASEVEKKV
jgi:hypothetical protein